MSVWTADAEAERATGRNGRRPRVNPPEAPGTNARHFPTPSEALLALGPHGERRGSQWILDGISVKYLRSEMKCRGPEA
jgi:hypothetical protein